MMVVKKNLTNGGIRFLEKDFAGKHDLSFFINIVYIK